MDKTIETQQLTRHFGVVRAVNALNLTVERGEVFGLLGPNGAGKTTIVRLLNGVLSPSAGQARVLGLDPAVQGSQVRRQTGVLTETPSLYERLSARRNLLIYGALYGIDDGRLPVRVDEMLELFELSRRADDLAGGFSKGMKQRLALARALLHQPQLLFLDEPTSGLDPEAARQVTELIEQLSHEGGRTVLLCTHNLDEAQRLCDHVAVVNQGQLLAVGTPQQLSRQLWQAAWLDVELQDAPPDGLDAALRAAPGVVEVELRDRTLAVQIADEALIPQAVVAVVQHGGAIRRVNPREHTLEDIYFTLQQQFDAQQEA